jgi:2-O-methyltransferase
VIKAKANVTRYGLEDRIEILPLALSNQAGVSRFHVSSGHPDHLENTEAWDYGNKSSSLLPPAEVKTTTPWLRWNEVTAVETMTLDEFCRDRRVDRVDFIHLDVQGAELMVLEGATTTLRTVDMIWLEVELRELYEGQPLVDDVERFMRAHGFTKALEYLREIDGDQLYVKPRLLRRIHIVLATRRILRSVFGPGHEPRPRAP